MTITPPSPRSTWAESVLVATILALGAAVRLGVLDGGWFAYDQVRDAMAARDILSGREFPLVGPHSALGTVRLVGPLYYYLLALPYALSTNPAVGVGLMNLFGVVSIFLAYRLGREMFGPPVGLVAAALYAVFPMAVVSGRALWNPALTGFFLTTFLLSLWRFVVGGRAWLLAVVLFLYGALLQIHMSGALLLPLIAAGIVMYRPPIRRGPLIVGLASVGVLYAPYVVFQVRHGFPDVSALLTWLGPPREVPAWLIAVRGVLYPFFLPEGMASAVGEISPAVFPLVQRAELALFIGGLLALGALATTSPDRRPYGLLALWIALPFVAVPFNRVGVPWYYFDVIYPAQFLVIGLLLRAAAAPLSSKMRATTLTAVIGVCVVLQAWFLLASERQVRRVGLIKAPRGILLSVPDPSGGPVVGMPLRDMTALAKTFAREFGADHASVERRAHGPLYQLFREDKGLLLTTAGADPASGRADPMLHFVIVPNASRGAVAGAREARAGAYRIVAYRPSVAYASWKWSVSPAPGWWNERFDDASWSSVAIPAREPPDLRRWGPDPFVRWAGSPVRVRGRLELPSLSFPVWIGINLRYAHTGRHEVSQLHVNGRPLTPERIVRHDTLSFQNTDVLVDVTAHLRPGSNLIAFEVAGTDTVFDLDVYELMLTDPRRVPFVHLPEMAAERSRR